MINTMLSYSMGYTNYSILNKPNIFNAFISILEMTPDENKRKIIELLKINIGKTFTQELKIYIFEKISDSPLLTYF